MAELTLEEAREIYKQSDSLKEMMLKKFSKEELEKHEVAQEEFDKKFLELLGKCTKTVFLDENGYSCRVPTNRIELRNSDGELMFDIQFNGENKHFWVNYCPVWKIFEDNYHLTYYEIHRFMEPLIKFRFGLDTVIPTLFIMNNGTLWQELTLEEARKIYKYDELKAMMLSKFSKEALEKDMQYADSGIEKLPSIQVKMKYDIVNNMMNGLSEYAFYTEFAEENSRTLVRRDEFYHRQPYNKNVY